MRRQKERGGLERPPRSLPEGASGFTPFNLTYLAFIRTMRPAASWVYVNVPSLTQVPPRIPGIRDKVTGDWETIGRIISIRRDGGSGKRSCGGVDRAVTQRRIGRQRTHPSSTRRRSSV
jgi:hypothetical protein